MIATIDLMLGIDDESYSAAFSFFQDAVGLIVDLYVDVTFFDGCDYGYDDWDYFAVIGISGDAGIGVKFETIGFFFYRFGVSSSVVQWLFFA